MTSLVPKKPSALQKRTKGPLDFTDHGSFHGTVTRAILGAGTGALAAHVFSWLSGFELAASPAFTITVAAGALAFVAARGKKWLKGLLGGVLGAAGGTLFALTAGQGLWVPFGAALLGAAAAPILAMGESNKRKVVTGIFAAGFSYMGIYVGNVLLSAGILGTYVPGPIASAIAGASVGLFMGLAAAPKHLARPMDPVEVQFIEAMTVKDGELHEILARALTIHQAVKTDLTSRRDEKMVAKLGERVGELMLRILHIARQCRRIEEDLAAAPAYELEERIASLRRKADSATDASAKQTYLNAIDSLDGQRRALEAIRRGRERVIARLHANVALLEKVRFSLLHLRSADTERFGGEGSPVADAVEELSREIDETSAAVGEVFGKTDPQHAAFLDLEQQELDNVVPLQEGVKPELRIADRRAAEDDAPTEEKSPEPSDPEDTDTIPPGVSDHRK